MVYTDCWYIVSNVIVLPIYAIIIFNVMCEFCHHSLAEITSRPRTISAVIAVLLSVVSCVGSVLSAVLVLCWFCVVSCFVTVLSAVLLLCCMLLVL